MNGTQLFEAIKEFSSVVSILQTINFATPAETQSKRGNIVEKLWDIVIKFGFCSLLPNDTYNHFDGSVNECKLSIVDNLEIYLEKMLVFGKGKGGSSDITLQNKKTEKWIFISSKFYLDDRSKSVDDYDVGKIALIIKTFPYKYKEAEIYVVVNDREKLLETIKSSHSSSSEYLTRNFGSIMDLTEMMLQTNYCF